MSQQPIVGKVVLILGAGQIGLAVARRLLAYTPAALVLHTRTEAEARAAHHRLLTLHGPIDTPIHLSWGDAFVPADLMHRLDALGASASPAIVQQLYNFLYGETTADSLKQAAIYTIIARWQPALIIDGINTATIAGSIHDPYTSARTLMRTVQANADPDQLLAHINSIIAQALIPKLVRFVQALHLAMTSCEVEHYIKISTTGLGGMGVNIAFTHGSTPAYGLAPELLGKVAAAGVLHQLLWALSHTPGLDIRLIVPATLVGWDHVRVAEFAYPAATCPPDTLTTTELVPGALLPEQAHPTEPGTIRIPVVSSGENKEYALAEMTAITALGQMGAITKEEVADALIADLQGRGSFNLFQAMDNVCLGPSYAGFAGREVVLARLRSLEAESGLPSIATGNLGPTVAKHLFELAILKTASQSNLATLLNTPLDDLVSACHQVVRHNQPLRAQILALGLPILLDNSHALMGAYCQVPGREEGHLITAENLEGWADRGWVDLRPKQLKHWQNNLRSIMADAEQRRREGTSAATLNAAAIHNDLNIGEYLAYYYTMTGSGRHLLP